MDSNITVEEFRGLQAIALEMAYKEGFALVMYHHFRKVEEECGLYTTNKDGYWSRMRDNSILHDVIHLRIKDHHKWMLAKIKYGF